MHLLLRDGRGLDEDADAVEPDQTPADLLLLSFSDSDLGAAASAWREMPEAPPLRLTRLSRLRHPMSADLYLERVASGARGIILRLLGGLEYWRYGAEELSALCRSRGIALAVLPGDDRIDPRLAALSTVPPEALTRLDDLLRHGGPANLRRALRLTAHLAGLGEDDGEPAEPLPRAGLHPLPRPERPWAEAVVVFYRSHLLAGDTQPVEAVAAALAERGIGTRAIHVSSLKDADAAGFVADRLREWRPDLVLNATGFSARLDGGSPLDAAGVPVLQLVLSGSSHAAWAGSSRGLSPADLAMQVVLPELDGRLLAGAISFKAEHDWEPALQWSRTRNRADPDGVAQAADRAAGWARLARTPAGERRLAIVLSDYPGQGGQVGHAVGLDSFASLDGIIALLRDEGYATGTDRPDLVRALCHAEPAPLLPLAEYRRLFAALPEPVRVAVTARWGEPDDDASVRNGWITLRHRHLGELVCAIQPDRGGPDRKAGYHDPDTPPCHGYVAVHLWLRHVFGAHAIVHLGAHGTLEWLPGKAAALSASCLPAALLGGLPVIYPYIVNDPGEAASAKRRLGAVTIGHLTPPMRRAGSHGDGRALEALLDEYAAADGLDRRRTALLRRDILDRAASTGLLAESGADPGLPDDDQLARLDAYLCDVKALMVRDGLHVFGRDPEPDRRALLLESTRAPTEALDDCAGRERDALVAALDGRFVQPGPAGAPTRGRIDVLPTGRNLTTADPRMIPTGSAVRLAEKAVAELLRRHRQEQGDWLRRLVVDLWGSATMRTGGEELATAMLLMGVRPSWDAASGRVTGFEIEPLATLDRPRVDVTLRISGVFRDAFGAQVALFDQAVRAVAERDEADEWNPLAAALRGLDGEARRRATIRVYGARPGSYGTGLDGMIGAGADRDAIGSGYIAASCATYGRGVDGTPDADGFAARVAAAEAFLHVQDHGETDLLDGGDYAAHEGGFAAAAAMLGAEPVLYHADTASPDDPRLRTLEQEVIRVVRGRAANPLWLRGMMRHGYRGAAEIARALDGLHGFAATLPVRFDRQFDLLHAATLGTPAVAEFLRRENPDAHAEMVARFAQSQQRGLWHPRRNAVGAEPAAA